MRVLLFTGNGGAGTSTCAAATAVQSAAAGHKTLLVATGPARSLGDICGAALGPQPLELAAGLYAAHLDGAASSGDGWGELQDLISSAAHSGGFESMPDAELALLPGVADVLALLEVQSQIESGRWGAVVVDWGAAAHGVPMLALPATLTSYLERLFPLPRKGLRAVAPTLTGTPRARAYDAVGRLHDRLRRVRDLLADSSTSAVRLVVTPEAVAVAAARRTFTALSLHGFCVDEVIANRVIQTDRRDPTGSRVATQRIQLARIRASFGCLGIRLTPDLEAEPVGIAALAGVGGALYGEDDPLAARPHLRGVEVERGHGTFILSLALPLVERDEVDLVRRGDDLVVTVQGQRRALTLPSALRRCVVTGARLAAGRLSVDFVPDPAQWLRG